MSATELAPKFLFAVVVILLTCRLVGWALRRIGQPPVVGEMLTGVLLGPSLVGAVLPGVEHFVFPVQLKPVLYVGGQIGLVVFMFGSGYEFPTARIRQVARPASVISGLGVLVPLLLGVGLAALAGGTVSLRPQGISFTVSALFIGVTLAITAFPMLARIITERGLSGTHHGSLSLACGALDDVLAWVMLAGVLSIAGASPRLALKAVAGLIGLVIMLAVVMRRHRWIADRAHRLSQDQLLMLVLSLLFLAAWFADQVGLYAVFGAFSLGLAVPRTPNFERVVATLRPIGLVFVPLFFTYSGLNTEFGLLGHTDILIFTAGAVVAAIIGKFGACWLGARLVGESQATALRVGTLMNARGLMQLIAINVGLSAGIVTRELFSVLVIVALVTTVMATPLLAVWDRRDARRSPDQAQPASARRSSAELTGSGDSEATVPSPDRSASSNAMP